MGTRAKVKTAMIVKEMLDTPYELGKVDCVSFILDYFEQKGVDMPDKWRDWTRDNYAKRWANGEGREELYLWLHGLGVEVEINYMIESDLILIDTPEGVTPALYMGNNNILIITIESGLFVMPLMGLRKNIREVRRLG